MPIKNVSYSNSYEYDSKPGEKGKIVNRVKTHGAESEPEQPGEGNRYGSKINPEDDENASNKKGVIGIFNEGIREDDGKADAMQDAKDNKAFIKV